MHLRRFVKVITKPAAKKMIWHCWVTKGLYRTNQIQQMGLWNAFLSVLHLNVSITVYSPISTSNCYESGRHDICWDHTWSHIVVIPFLATRGYCCPKVNITLHPVSVGGITGFSAFWLLPLRVVTANHSPSSNRLIDWAKNHITI